ncbi:prostaglandin E synthase 3 isoform X2 [Eurytemora carolleeae]|uniref:prostaglandin E synthase 3 isoform X2 n=1 Tax=Eurytemora carolleeae TaxID=1294199 RepID=UPI000C7565A0|nr:prostaglandin E synthase 3 isoform X2 [Eurytemora carolleeae]|eukprot:XP_023340914.1 prostaglandin E synthase 3-like isoform X2 [Eurytemora affinis]
MAAKIPPPGCTWAQRPKHIILTICLTDVKDPVIKVEPGKLYFKGVGGTEMKEHEVEMVFFKPIDVEKSKFGVRPREISFVLEKQEEGPYWDRLLETKVKQPWLRVDFKNWKDEDDDEEEGGAQGQDLEEMMRQMGGLGGAAGGAGAADMGDLAKKAYQRPSLDDLDIDDEEDDMPDLE